MNEEKRVIKKLLLRIRTWYLNYIENERDESIKKVWELLSELVCKLKNRNEETIKKTIDLCFVFAYGKENLDNTADKLVTF